MKNIYIKSILFGVLVIFTSCQLDEIENPNAPPISSFDLGASQADIQTLAIGLEAIMRNDLEFHYDTVSILGREYYDLTGVDPRFTGEILKGPLDDNGFLTTRAFAAWYKIVQSANILISAVQNSEAGFTDQDKNGYLGYAKTLKAYALLMVANRQYEDGIRIDVADPDNLGPIIEYEPALQAISDLLNEANNDLSNATESFDFVLSPGFMGFSTTANFSEFNRAIAARVALYRENYSEVLQLLDESFLDLEGDLYTGPAHVFGSTGNDILNAQFHILGQSGQEFTLHNSFVADAEEGDTRIDEKAFLLEEPATFDDLTGDYQIAIYRSDTDPVYLIRNEELILMYAEAKVRTGDTDEAIEAINIIRNAASLDDYSGDTSEEALIEEILSQRRYSLVGEGHRWIDLRRLDRLTPEYIPLDRAGDNIITSFPTPFTEGTAGS